jgi:hypothetical protein
MQDGVQLRNSDRFSSPDGRLSGLPACMLVLIQNGTGRVRTATTVSNGDGMPRGRCQGPYGAAAALVWPRVGRSRDSSDPATFLGTNLRPHGGADFTAFVHASHPYHSLQCLMTLRVMISQLLFITIFFYLSQRRGSRMFRSSLMYRYCADILSCCANIPLVSTVLVQYKLDGASADVVPIFFPSPHYLLA